MPAEDLTTDDGVTIRDALIPAQAKAQDRAQGDTYAEPASADTAFQHAADVLASYGYGTIIPDGAVVVQNGEALTVPVTGTYTSTATLTVEGGAITGIVLS